MIYVLRRSWWKERGSSAVLKAEKKVRVARKRPPALV